jgi:cytochrome c oxidase assembly protein subunit 11
MSTPDKDKANARLVRRMVLIVIAMFGFGFAMVPLYGVFCDITGLNGKVKNEAAGEMTYPVDEGREINLEFVTSLNENMPLAFRAERSKIKVHPGEYYTVKFYAENLSDGKLVGQAIPSVAPGLATSYLNKTECFCFSKQEFEPHRIREMPVRFTIDPKIPADIKDMTLSYTFFDISEKNQN